MLKPSKFNYFTYTDMGEMLLTNTYSGCLLKVSSEQIGIVSKYLNGKTNNENAVVKFLYARGVLVEDSVDESVKVKNAFTLIQGNPILTLTILPTEACNFRCIYCPESFNRGEMSEEVQEAVINYVKQNINKYVGVKVVWFGGEPLLAMEIILKLSREIKKLCKLRNRKYVSHITTNAYLLTAKSFKLLLECDVLDYQITLDGTKESHDKQRPLCDGSPTYDVIVNNLREIQQQFRTGKFRIILRINVSLGMIPQIPQYVEWYKKYFGSDQRFFLAIKMVSDYGGDRVKDISETMIAKTGSEKLFFSSIISSDLKNCKLLDRSLFSVGGMLCTAVMKSAVIIDSSGSIRKCSCNLEDNTFNNFGSILNKKVEMDYNYIRWNEMIHDKACEDCYFYPVCMGSYCKFKRISTKDRCCPNEKAFFAEYLKIFDKQELIENVDSFA